MIKSRQNPKIKKLFKLQQKKYRLLEDEFLVFGDHLIEEAKKCGFITQIYTSNPLKEGILIEESLIKELTSIVSFPDTLAIVKKPKFKDYSNKILLLDGIQDPGNMGTLIRSAIGFGFKTIISSLDSVDFYNEKVIRATQGSLFYSNIKSANLKEEIINLKEKGYYILASFPHGENLLKNYIKAEKIVLILGSEGFGIKDEIKRLANEFVSVKTKDIESLNVAVAGSILMYELGGEKL